MDPHRPGRLRTPEPDADARAARVRELERELLPHGQGARQAPHDLPDRPARLRAVEPAGVREPRPSSDALAPARLDRVLAPDAPDSAPDHRRALVRRVSRRPLRPSPPGGRRAVPRDLADRRHLRHGGRGQAVRGLAPRADELAKALLVPEGEDRLSREGDALHDVPEVVDALEVVPQPLYPEAALAQGPGGGRVPELL